jgi:hypothetical protein
VKSLTILVAENDANDIIFMQKAFKKNEINVPLNFCENGEELIDYLQGEGKLADREKYVWILK